MRIEVLDFVYRTMEAHHLARNAAGSVLDVGAIDINGTVKDQFTLRGWKYTGFDCEPGKGVDVVGDATRLLDHFKAEQFDCVISCETLEHVFDMAQINQQMRSLVKPGGLYILTIAGNGFFEHRHPVDCWRVLPDGMKWLFRGFERIEVEEVMKGGKQAGIMGSGYKPKMS